MSQTLSWRTLKHFGTPKVERLSIIYIHFSPDAIDFSLCDAVHSFEIDQFQSGKVFEDGLIVAFSAGELNAQGFGKERTNNWNGMNLKFTGIISVQKFRL